MKKFALCLLVSAPVIFFGCSKYGSSSSTTGTGTTTTADINDEMIQQVGENMASIDESGGNSGTIALEHSIEKTFHRLAPNEGRSSFWNHFSTTPAYATSCRNAGTFGQCVSNTITRNFNDCSIGVATFTGTVLLTWGGTSAGCQLSAFNDTITRDPNLTITGLRGSNLTVSRTGATGQQLTWISGSNTNKVFNYTNDGLRRVFKNEAGTTLLDFTAETTSAIIVTGTSRSDRKLDGGELKVTNNKTNVSCSYVPTDVTWSGGTCNCASSGTWEGTCSNGNATKLTITGCGSANLTVGPDIFYVNFDRCEID